MRSGDRPALADLRSDIGHSLTPHAGDVAGDLRGRLHEEVAQSAGDLDVVRAQGDPNALSWCSRPCGPCSGTTRCRCCSRCCGWDWDFYFSRPHFNRGGRTSAVLGGTSGADHCVICRLRLWLSKDPTASPPVLPSDTPSQLGELVLRTALASLLGRSLARETLRSSRSSRQVFLENRTCKASYVMF